MKLIVHSNPVPAPRMTQRDKWKKRPVVMAYWDWRDRIFQAWAELPIKKRKKFTTPVTIGFRFFIKGYPNADLDNYIKGVKDALVKYNIIPDDNIKFVKEYDHVGIIFLCNTCIYKKGCKSIKSCQFGAAIITINKYIQKDYV